MNNETAAVITNPGMAFTNSPAWEPTPDPISEHQALADEAARYFRMIFGFHRLEKMLHRLNLLRMSASTWDDAKWRHVPTWHEADLKEIVDLARKCTAFVYRDRMAVAEDQIEKEYFETTFNELQLSLYEHERLCRKRDRGVSLSLLSPGTKVEVKIAEGAPEIMTVISLSNVSHGSAIVTFEEKEMRYGNPYNGFFPRSEHRQCNTDWITRLVKHVPGRPRFREYHDSEAYYAQSQAGDQVGKRKASYAVSFNGATLMQLAVDRLGIETRDTDQYVDTGAMMRAYVLSHHLKTKNEDTWAETTIISKKKFKRWVRQNVNRFLVSRSDQEQEWRRQQAEEMREYERDMRDDD